MKGKSELGCAGPCVAYLSPLLSIHSTTSFSASVSVSLNVSLILSKYLSYSLFSPLLFSLLPSLVLSLWLSLSLSLSLSFSLSISFRYIDTNCLWPVKHLCQDLGFTPTLRPKPTPILIIPGFIIAQLVSEVSRIIFRFP